MRPRRVILVFDPMPADVYALIPIYDGQHYLWHVHVLCNIIITLSKLHIAGESDATALAVVYIDASSVDLLATPEQSAYLRRCYGQSQARVTAGLVQTAADYLGFEHVTISVSSPAQDTEPLQTIKTEAIS